MAPLREVWGEDRAADAAAAAGSQSGAAGDRIIASASEALDVFDLEAAARPNVPPAHWGYLQTGVDGDVTLRANQAAFARYGIKPKRFVDVSQIKLATTLFGTSYNSPIFLCPVGGLKSIHPDGELAVARAAKAKNALQILSTVASTSVEDVTTAREAPVWFQLYTSSTFDTTKKIVKRAEAAGCPVMAVTVDLPAGRNLETYLRMRRADKRVCSGCHPVDASGYPAGGINTKPMFAGLDTQAVTSASLTWDFIKRLKDITSMKILVKGIEAAEDAALAVKHGADGIIVSNHGGRATESGRATIESLPEVVKAVRGRIPVLFDSGVRRGSDAFKALALGATAVGIGRAYAWGLGAFGQAGVERALDILNLELRLAMVGAGARSPREITASSLIAR
jgi:isopentenyl diphosphate isomerase/L-lactate dehydrogenase-like FMN-dependent dehydrogenase